MHSPLDPDSVQRLDATLLPALQRHHLRLMAHCLATFQSMSAPGAKELPGEKQRLAWCSSQAPLRNDPAFTRLFLEQLAAAACRLEDLSRRRGLRPLELGLQDLIEDAEAHARPLNPQPAPPRPPKEVQPEPRRDGDGHPPGKPKPAA